MDTIRPFSCCVLIKGASDADGKHTVYGPVASHVTDYDGEIMEKAGVWTGLDMHDKLGSPVDWEHQFRKTKDPNVIIGKGVKRALIDGVPHLETLLKTTGEYALPLAKSVWQMAARGDHMGYSLEGIAKARDAKNPKRILQTEIHFVTLSAQPKGFDQKIYTGEMPTMAAMTKAICDEFDKGECSEWQPVDYTSTYYSIPASLGKGIPNEATSHDTCSKCGGKMSCIHCINAARAGKTSKVTDDATSVDDAPEDVDKAMTTGEGIVQVGTQGAPALRTQTIDGKVANECGKCGKKCKTGSKYCDACKAPIKKALEIEKALSAGGCANPKEIARALAGLR